MPVFTLLIAYGASAELGRGVAKPLNLSPEGRAAIDRIQAMHRPASAYAMTESRRTYHDLERATRRVGLLLADTAVRSDPKERGEALGLLQAEWAKWKQLKQRANDQESEAKPAGRRGGRENARRAKRARQLIALERTMAREMREVERLMGLPDDERDREGRRLIRRLKRRPRDPSDTLPHPMFSVSILRPDAQPEQEGDVENVLEQERALGAEVQ